MRNESVLVVDDAPEIRAFLTELLQGEGFAVETATDGQEAIEMLEGRFFDVVLTDVNMPRKDGMAVLDYIQEHSPDSICILVTGYGSIRDAVEAMRKGAFDYLTKPVKAEEVALVIERALEVRELRRENQNLKKELRTRYGFDRIVGASPAMQDLFDLIEKVADTESTVLITGESGTGKELIAHAIHFASDRRDNSFIPINCGAIPPELLESELFGHEKGAFTHAIRTRIGRFELANKGTIFLDEVGEMSPALQVKLLRVLQDRQFERVGGVRTIRVDIRVIAATNIDLEEAVREGRFREDLYYRLNVIPIHVPPLRERVSDIPLLVQHFLERFRQKNRGRLERVAEDAMQCLMAYEWPGNVRELENLMERMSILASGPVLTAQDLPASFTRATGYPLSEGIPVPVPTLPEEGLSLNAAVQTFEKNLILQALDRTGGVKNRAAQLLRLNRTTLIEKMKKQRLMTPATRGRGGRPAKKKPEGTAPSRAAAGA
ncbi:sigma-54-dependent Fis family transcriptional regulator [Dissulfurirhabdus thermomarina]|uniref:Sigma-54-dependent Fis family transcriptional regulator n=1 Tax=Dissulfurirhabdus thermomarina TaxID=1765737 RepID=A0A6N9TT26_DISTH|nr:sigma-54 dependent transcriptional regulator [Dissulfurirhabdus thermomarina]NDY41686.1 sigma-54-dependent Fis family transcriptional regulator [Dissulfurirhabdus thermomarina]NMX22746.1 sigma-54-dependent Fis family transcriptional regulator [Dissulfurirhabdus thermomarina]